MPTARELLEQADALMRRNRGREPEPDIPELTDEVVVAEPAADPRRAQAPAASVARQDFDEVPELTDAVAHIEQIAVEPPPDEGVDSRWLESELGGASITGPAPDSIAVVPPATLRPDVAAVPEAEPERSRRPSDEHTLAPETAAAMLAATIAVRADAAPTARDSSFDAMLGLPADEVEFERELAPDLAPSPAELVEEAATASVELPVSTDAPSPEPSAHVTAPIPADAGAAAPVPAAAPSWEAVAEEIRMQVLQRIDIFTDTGLQGELAARLQPVVDRASADLIATINREVGQLLRTYVAEAIEREIEKWRQSQP